MKPEEIYFFKQTLRDSSIQLLILTLTSYDILYCVVDESFSERLLGVTINNDLSWNTQVENVIQIYNTFLYLLFRIKVFLSFQNRTRFYNAYILPHFDLCCVIWGNCTSVIEDKLVKLQKRAARAILDVEFTVPSETMFTQLKWMTFPRMSCLPPSNPNVQNSLWRCT